MASIYKQRKSRFWWIKFIDPATGKTLRQSSKLGFDSEGTKRARQLVADYTYRESRLVTATEGERWGAWVPTVLADRYGPGKTRAVSAWRNLAIFFKEKKIDYPRQLLREHCSQYLAWRATPTLVRAEFKDDRKYKAGSNTAQLEIKILRILMTEAVLRNYVPLNPCHDLRFRRLPGKQKPELPAAALEKIWDEIVKLPEPRQTFFRNSFLIARYHGVRLAETHLNPMDNVRLAAGAEGPRGSITFHVKGRKIHTVNLHQKLLPLFTQLLAEAKTETYAMPLSPAKDWFNFLNRIGIKKDFPGACFHSLRVTAATTLARKGVSEKKAMSYLGHASTTVHRSYVKLKPDDLGDCAAALE